MRALRAWLFPLLWKLRLWYRAPLDARVDLGVERVEKIRRSA